MQQHAPYVFDVPTNKTYEAKTRPTLVVVMTNPVVDHLEPGAPRLEQLPVDESSIRYGKEVVKFVTVAEGTPIRVSQSADDVLLSGYLGNVEVNGGKRVWIETEEAYGGLLLDVRNVERAEIFVRDGRSVELANIKQAKLVHEDGPGQIMVKKVDRLEAELNDGNMSISGIHGIASIEVKGSAFVRAVDMHHVRIARRVFDERAPKHEVEQVRSARFENVRAKLKGTSKLLDVLGGRVDATNCTVKETRTLAPGAPYSFDTYTTPAVRSIGLV